MQSRTLHSLFQTSCIVQRMNDCTQRCCSCSHAEPASFGEHRGREAGGPVILHRCEGLSQPLRFQAAIPVPPLATAKPFSCCHHSFHCSSRKQNQPNFLRLFISRHTMEKQGSVAKRKMKGPRER